MKPRRHVDAFLDKAQSTNNHYLGADSIDKLTADTPNILAAYRFRKRTNSLIRSRHVDDVRAVKQINKVFEKNDMEYFMAMQDNPDSFEYPITTESPGITQWLSQSSKYDISTFCRWNVERTHELQSAINRDKPVMTDKVLEKTQALSDIGLFPKFAPIIMKGAIDRYSLGAMDTFLSAGLFRVGFCNDRKIVLANMYDNSLALSGETIEQNRIVFHEYLHGAGRDRGFFRGIHTYLSPLRPLEEAFVEHATMVAQTQGSQNPEVIDPKSRTLLFKNYGGYTKERSLLDTIIKKTDISIEQMGEAYFTPVETERGEKIRADIEQKIGAFFLSKDRFFDFVDKYEDSNHVDRAKLITDVIKWA